MKCLTVVKCYLFCESNDDNLCTEKEIELDEYGKCGNYKFDSTKALCFCCENCESGEDIHYGIETVWNKCSIDNHKVNALSKCTNGKFATCD